MSYEPLFWINQDDVTLPAESNMIYVTASNFDRNTIPVYGSYGSRQEIEDLRARIDKLYVELTNERILRYAAEAERNTPRADKPSILDVPNYNASLDLDTTGEYFISGWYEADFLSYLEKYASGIRNAETERCSKIAQDCQLSPVVGKAIAALIVNLKQIQST